MVKSLRSGRESGKDEIPGIGGMAEWLKAPVLKTGLEQSNVGSNPSPSAEAINNWGGAREADWARLLSECWALNSAAGSNPALPARYVEHKPAFYCGFVRLKGVEPFSSSPMCQAR